MSDWPSPRPLKPITERRSPIHTEYKKTRNVVYSSEESKIYGTFNNRKIAINMQPALTVLDHKKPATTPKTENSTTQKVL